MLALTDPHGSSDCAEQRSNVGTRLNETSIELPCPASMVVGIIRISEKMSTMFNALICGSKLGDGGVIWIIR